MTKANVTRRAVFPRIAGLAVGIGAGVAMLAASDPVVELVERYCALWPLCPRSGNDAVADARWNEEISKLEAAIAASRPDTKDGALSIVRFVAFKMEDDAVDGEMLGALTASISTLAREA